MVAEGRATAPISVLRHSGIIGWAATTSGSSYRWRVLANPRKMPSVLFGSQVRPKKSLDQQRLVGDRNTWIPRHSTRPKRPLSHQRLGALAEAIDWILQWHHQEAPKVEGDQNKKTAHRRYQDAVLSLSKAYALASASDEARAIQDEVGFFQSVRAALAKTTATGKLSDRAKSFAVEQLLNDAVASAESWIS